jgi:hypothetical protein
MVLNCQLPSRLTSVVHIFQNQWRRNRYLLKLDDVDDHRNLLLLYSSVARAFMSGEFMFLWSEDAWKVRLLNPALGKRRVFLDDDAEHAFPSLPDLTFQDLEGRSLVFPPEVEVRPYKRCLAFHAVRARYNAVKRGWKKEDDLPPEMFNDPQIWSPHIMENRRLKSLVDRWLNNVMCPCRIIELTCAFFRVPFIYKSI